MVVPAAERIVTLLPSATEIVCALGLQHKLVGVTHECDWPPGIESLPRLTRSAIPEGLSSGEIDAVVREQLRQSDALYHIDDELLAALEPDLIVTQALCDVCAVTAEEVQAAVARLPATPKLVNLEPMSLEQVLDTIELVGCAAGCTDEGARVVGELRARIGAVVHRKRTGPAPRIGFLEWIDPPFNGGHWNPELIEMAGAIDCFGSKNAPSRTITFEEVQAADPDILVISLCGFDPDRAAEDLPILQQRLDWEKLKCVQDEQVFIMDGNSYFSRPGPRLVDSLEQLANIVDAWREPTPEVPTRAWR